MKYHKFSALPDWLHTPTSKDSCGHYVPQRYLTHKAIKSLAKEFEHISSEILLVTMCTSGFEKLMVTIVIDTCTLLACSTYTSPLYAAVTRASFTYKAIKSLGKEFKRISEILLVTMCASLFL